MRDTGSPAKQWPRFGLLAFVILGLAIGSVYGFSEGTYGSLSRASATERAVKTFFNSLIAAVQGACICGLWYELIADASKKRRVSLRFLFKLTLFVAIALATFVYWSAPVAERPAWFVQWLSGLLES